MPAPTTIPFRRSLFRVSLSLFLALLALCIFSEFIRTHYSSSSAPPQFELDLSHSTLTITRDTEQLEQLGYSLFFFEQGWTFTRQYVGSARAWLPSIDTVVWACRTTTITIPLWIPLAAAAAICVVFRPRQTLRPPSPEPPLPSVEPLAPPPRTAQ